VAAAKLPSHRETAAEHEQPGHGQHQPGADQDHQTVPVVEGGGAGPELLRSAVGDVDPQIQRRETMLGQAPMGDRDSAQVVNIEQCLRAAAHPRQRKRDQKVYPPHAAGRGHGRRLTHRRPGRCRRRGHVPVSHDRLGWLPPGTVHCVPGNGSKPGGAGSPKGSPNSSRTGHGCGRTGGMDEKSGMTGDCHVPFRGSLGVKLPGATRLRVRLLDRPGTPRLSL